MGSLPRERDQESAQRRKIKNAMQAGDIPVG